MLSYGWRYCSKCDKWFIPENIGELKYCPVCHNEVIGDE